ncbi:peptidyl-tRNA hydrolase [Sedimentitalea sp. CY04]|uniref:Peptidyl-tRNA hydrolase n=2 Tax=Parasedimentitalea denitrificans TaxID=2211118 RepID=A0ABX0W397_9RHOB|nr:peptidyl-tRNA hydrolase [Sedimentitalea sp. CY04]
MFDGIYDEETALRRRLLFRLLRGFNFDEPQYRGEAISEPVPKALITTDYLRYDRGPTVSNHCQL